MALNPRQAKFAELYHLYGNATRAYGEAYDVPVTERGRFPSWCAVEGNRLLRNPNIRKELALLRGEAEKLSEMSREEMIDFLVAAITTPIDQIGPDSPLCEEWTVHQKPGNDDQEAVEVVKIKAISKTVALKELAALCGFKAPQKVELSADSEVVNMLRALSGAKEKE
jgi:hypothetical protein